MLRVLGRSTAPRYCKSSGARLSSTMPPRGVDFRKHMRNCHASDGGEPFQLRVYEDTFEGDSLPMQMLRLLVRSLPQ